MNKLFSFLKSVSKEYRVEIVRSASYIQHTNESIIHLKVYNIYYAEAYTQMIDISFVEDVAFDYEDIIIEKIKEAIAFFEQKKKGM